MATPTYLEGFECQSLLAHGGTTSGAPTIVAGGAYGSWVLQCAPAGAAVLAKTPTSGVFGNANAVHRFRFRFTSSLPSANVSELAVWFTPGSDFALGFVQSTGKLELRKRANAVGTGVSSAVTITAGQWYLLEFKLFAGGTTWTGDWQIDGSAQTQLSFADTSNTFDSYEFGTSTTDTYSAQYDDSMAGITTGDYPFGDGKVLGYLPGTTSGTHTQTAGDLQTDASTNVTNGDSSGAQIGEGVADTTTFIKQVVSRSTTYYEGIYATSGVTETPTDVLQIVAIKNVSGTQTNNQKAQLYDGTSAADMYASVSIGSASLVYKQKVWNAAPSTGAWTQAKFQACRIRWGFSTDISPVPALSWTILEANFTVMSAPTGDGGVSLPGPSIAGTGVMQPSGSGGVSLPGPALSGTGGETFAGSGGVTVPAPTIGGSGSEAFTGTGSVTLPGPSVSGAGGEAFTGSAAITMPAAAIAASGNVDSGAAGVTGTGDVTIPAPALSGTGTEEFTGSGGATLPGPSISATGAEAFTGTGAVALPGPTIGGTGTEAMSGAAALTIPGPAITGDGVQIQNVTGSGGVTIPAPSISADGIGGLPPVVEEPVFDRMMDEGVGPGSRGATPFDDWTITMDDDAILELYVLRKTR